MLSVCLHVLSEGSNVEGENVLKVFIFCDGSLLHIILLLYSLCHLLPDQILILCVIIMLFRKM